MDYTFNKNTISIRARICFWFTCVHIVLLLLCIIGIAMYGDSDASVRWNLAPNVIGVTWLTGIIAFLTGIKIPKNRIMVSPYLLHIVINWLSNNITSMGLQSTQYAASDNYTVHTSAGFLSTAQLYLSRTSGIFEYPVCTFHDTYSYIQSYKESDYSLTEDLKQE